MNKKEQANNVYRIKSRECKTNTGSIVSYYNQLFIAYGITIDENELSKTSKTKWKTIVKSKVIHQENQWYKTESSELSKLQEINKRKKRIKRYKYVTEFRRSGFSLLKKARLRMLNLKNKFKRQFKGDVSYPLCNLGIDDENHVFEAMQNLKNYMQNMKFLDFKIFLKT